MRELVMEFFEKLNEAVNRASDSDDPVKEIEDLLSDWFLIADAKGVKGGFHKGPDRKFLEASCKNPDAGKGISRLQLLDITPIDSHFCLAHVDATYLNEEGEVCNGQRRHFFLHLLDGKVQTFGWIVGDADDKAASGVCAA